MHDFTLQQYKALLEALNEAGYSFTTVKNYISHNQEYAKNDKVIILRHDIDKRPTNALRMAQLENEYNIQATYYFRAKRGQEPFIRAISDLGHEIGYHYEDVATAKGGLSNAYISFESNLKLLRQYADIKTCSKHGTVRSKFDEHKLWEDYDYRQFDLIGEAYLDINFRNVVYLTDTGRMWDGYMRQVNRYDRVKVFEQAWTEKGSVYHSTQDIITAIKQNRFPQEVMLNVHPQRWTDNTIVWLIEYIMQNMANTIKKQITR